MLTEQRFDIILKLLEERKSITVTELRELLDASESTVSRDITALDKAGKLTKVFGGAVALNHKVTAYEPTVAQKSELNKESCSHGYDKRAIIRTLSALSCFEYGNKCLRFRACDDVGFNLHQYSCFALS